MIDELVLSRLNKDEKRFINTHLLVVDRSSVDGDGNLEITLAAELDKYKSGILKVERTDMYVPFEAVILNPPDYRVAPFYSQYKKDRRGDELIVARFKEKEYSEPQKIPINQIGNLIGGEQKGENRKVKVNYNVLEAYRLEMSAEVERLDYEALKPLGRAAYKLGRIISRVTGIFQKPTK